MITIDGISQKDLNVEVNALILTSGKFGYFVCVITLERSDACIFDGALELEL